MILVSWNCSSKLKHILKEVYFPFLRWGKRGRPLAFQSEISPQMGSGSKGTSCAEVHVLWAAYPWSQQHVLTLSFPVHKTCRRRKNSRWPEPLQKVAMPVPDVSPCTPEGTRFWSFSGLTSSAGRAPQAWCLFSPSRELRRPLSVSSFTMDCVESFSLKSARMFYFLFLLLLGWWLWAPGAKLWNIIV